jgi:hypothetical protein
MLNINHPHMWFSLAMLIGTQYFWILALMTTAIGMMPSWITWIIPNFLMSSAIIQDVQPILKSHLPIVCYSDKTDTDDEDNADADARGRIFKVQDPDYDKLRPLSGWMNTKTIKKTLEQTSTQYAMMPNGTILKKHCKLSMCNVANVARKDTVYFDTPTIDGVRPVPRSLPALKPWLQTSMVWRLTSNLSTLLRTTFTNVVQCLNF